jgi:hypothetical protein
LRSRQSKKPISSILEDGFFGLATFWFCVSSKFLFLNRNSRDL